jgi:hypothetical protein
MKFCLRNLSIGHCTALKPCEVSYELRDERKIFKFGSEELPDVEAQKASG